MSLTVLQLFAVSKFITVLTPLWLINFNIIVAINIAEAVIADIFTFNYWNALYGALLVALMFRIRSITHFKLWSIAYALWNVIFIMTKDYSVSVAIANNLPALYFTLTNKHDTLLKTRHDWQQCRYSSVITQMINWKLLK